MIGSTVSARRMRFQRNPERVTTRAKARPRTVVMKPTATARTSEFSAAPHLVPKKQPIPHRRSSKNLPTNAEIEYAPSSVTKAENSMFAMGKNTKAVTMVTTPPIAPTTKTSPLTAPRAAMPWVKRKRKEEAQIIAPYPIPNWRSPSAPNAAFIHWKLNPRMPMENPWMINQPNPSAPATVRMRKYAGSDFSRPRARSGRRSGISKGASHSFSPCPIRNAAGE